MAWRVDLVYTLSADVLIYLLSPLWSKLPEYTCTLTQLQRWQILARFKKLGFYLKNFAENILTTRILICKYVNKPLK